MSAPQTPGYLPGQSPVGYGMTPGVHHDTGLGVAAPPAAPYGMIPGQRHILPDQINLDAVQPDKIDLDDPGYGNREDGTRKGRGFLGELKRPDGDVSTELSIGVDMGGGKEVEIPTLVPTLTSQERDFLLALPPGDASKIPDSIVAKAKAFAQSRISAGKSPFADDSESPGASPPPVAPGAPNVLPQTHSIRSFRVTNDKGETVADMPDNPTAGNGNDYIKGQVQKIGDSLVSQAVNPADKEAAARATQFGLSLVGLMPIKDIQSAIVHRYDTDERNSISRETQEAKSKRLAMRGGGGGAPAGAAGPTKADKYQGQLDDKLRGSIDKIIDSERQGTKYAAISEQENNIAQMDKLLAQPNAMGQRVAVQRALLELTGKASRESEQAALTGASGKWEELKNKLSLWTSDDPQLSTKYIAEFRQMLATQRQYIAEQKTKIADSAATRAASEAFGYPEDQRSIAYSIVHNAMTGNNEGASAYKPTGSAPAAPSASSPVSPHLAKYLK